MDVPKYEDGESVDEYMEKVELYNEKLSVIKYNFILNLINEYLKLDKKSMYTSLTNFKNISEKMIKENNEIITKNKDKIKEIFFINIKKKDFMFILKKLLKSIDYKLSYRTKNSIKYYTIKG